MKQNNLCQYKNADKGTWILHSVCFIIFYGKFMLGR